MALVECPDCQSMVSDQSATCIQCGRPMHQDLVREPATDSAETMMVGRRRAKSRDDIGKAVGFVGFTLAIIVGFSFGSFWVGLVLAVVVLGVGIFIAYGR